MNRRDLLEAAVGTVLLGASSCAYAFRLLRPPGKGAERTAKSTSDTKWGMVIDLTKCQADCTACIDACHEENNVGHSA